MNVSLNDKHWMEFMTAEEKPAYQRAKAIIQIGTSSPVQLHGALEVVAAINRWCVERQKKEMPPCPTST